jgi:hypothetical protein
MVFRLGDPRNSAAAKLSGVGRDPVGCGRKSFLARPREENERRVAIMNAARLKLWPKIKPHETEVIKVQMNLPPDATPLDFLSRVYVNDKIPVNLRIAAALGAAPYVHERVLMIKKAAPEEAAPTIIVEGGMPSLPGAPPLLEGTSD